MQRILKVEGLFLSILLVILIQSCKKDKAATFEVFDADGNGYNSVKIGNQTWLTENLKTTKYNNGDLIETTPLIKQDVSNELMPKYQWSYYGDESNAAVYGRLYTWFAATDSRHVCPTGWHVSTNNDWTVLENYLIANGYNYDSTLIDNKIGKSLASDKLWNNSSREGAIGNTDYPAYRNKSGFTALPGGVRSSAGMYSDIGNAGSWWTSTEIDSSFAWVRNMFSSNNFINRIGNLKADLAMSVRCVSDY